jgi:hypothetical protein
MHSSWLEKWWLECSILCVLIGFAIGIPQAIEGGNPLSTDNKGTIILTVFWSVGLAIIQYKTGIDAIRADYIDSTLAHISTLIKKRHRILIYDISIRITGQLVIILGVLYALGHTTITPALVKWEQALNEKEMNCDFNPEHAPTPAEKKKLDICVAEAINIDPPNLGGSDPAYRLAADVLSGPIYYSKPEIKKSLKSLLSVNERFLGTGLTLPTDVNDYTNAKLHEYLAPNIPEKSPDVWAWRLPDEYNNSNVISVLDSKKPVYTNEGEFRKFWHEQLSKILSDDKAPTPLIRFSIFNEQHASGLMGRCDAARVSFLSLREVQHLSLVEAVRLSGHDLGGHAGENRTLFIWLYLPKGGSEATPSTWKNIRENLKTWVEDKWQRIAELPPGICQNLREAEAKKTSS